MAKTITHLVPDSTFLPFIVSTFEEASPGNNHFVVYGLGGDIRRHGIADSVPVETTGIQAADIARIAASMANSRIAVYHSMNDFAAQVLLATPRSTLRVWSGWGGDYYGSTRDVSSGLLGPHTAALERQRRTRRTLKQWALRAYVVPRTAQLLHAAARATDVFSAPVPTDFAVFRRRFTGFTGRYSQLNYASVEDTYATEPSRLSGADILVGNSATPENNHLETFALLATLDLSDRNVVVPLSYGDPAYADEIESAGFELFGERFRPIRQYLPFTEYTKLIAQCDVIVMGHLRQQALGNVARALWQGAHVYLDARSPMLEYFRSSALSAGTLDDLAARGLPATRKTENDIAAIRDVARTLWGRDVVVGNIAALIALTDSD